MVKNKQAKHYFFVLEDFGKYLSVSPKQQNKSNKNNRWREGTQGEDEMAKRETNRLK